VATDAALRGYDTLLLEGSDFGKGTSSRSTKLVHGGVRYPLARQWARLIMQVRSGLLRAQEAARQLGISRKTYYKWGRRALAAMVEALGNREHGRPPLPVDPEKEAFQRQTQELQPSSRSWSRRCGSVSGWSSRIKKD
jgi:hypothetical protein